MLEITVNVIDDLRAVKTQAEQFSCQSQAQLTYYEYCSLLPSAAQSYDITFTTKAHSCGVCYSVYQHTLYDDGYAHIDHTDYTVDLPIQQLHANATNIQYHPQLEATYGYVDSCKPRLSHQQWT